MHSILKHVNSVLVMSSLVCLGLALASPQTGLITAMADSRILPPVTESFLELVGAGSQVKQCQIPGSGCPGGGNCMVTPNVGASCAPAYYYPVNPVSGVSYGSCGVCTNQSDVYCVTLTGSSTTCTGQGPSSPCPGQNFNCVYYAGIGFVWDFMGNGCRGGGASKTCI